MSSTVEHRLKIVFADVFDTTPGDISPQMSIANTVTWDSMQSIVLSSSVESEFGIEFSDDELLAFDSFQKVLEAVKSRQVPPGQR